MRPLIVGVLLALLPAERTADAAWCYTGWTTGYVRTDYGPSGRTYDGTSIYSAEPLAAGGWDIPLDSYVTVDGSGPYRIADRGRLAPGQVDVAVWTRREALNLTGWRQICVTPP